MIQRTENKDEKQPAEARSDRITRPLADPKESGPKEAVLEQAEIVSTTEVTEVSESSDRISEPVQEEINGVAGQVEALLFVATEALSVRRMAEVLGLNVALVRTALDSIHLRHATAGSGIQLSEIAGGWRLLTNPACADAVAALHGKRAKDRLSPAALETLAIIAYRQPVSRAEIERIRGVGVGPVLRHLLDLDLLRVSGREDGLGRARGCVWCGSHPGDGCDDRSGAAKADHFGKSLKRVSTGSPVLPSFETDW